MRKGPSILATLGLMLCNGFAGGEFTGFEWQNPIHFDKAAGAWKG